MFALLRPGISAQVAACCWLLNLGILWITVGLMKLPDAVGAEPGQSVEVRPIGKDKYNQMAFDIVLTSALRLEVDLQPDRSAGILEWTISE